MRFAWKGQEFDGPAIGNGVLAGFTVGERRWAKRELGFESFDTLDQPDMISIYVALSVRRHDPQIMSVQAFNDLELSEFEVLPHVCAMDREGNCRECSQPSDAPVHLDPLEQSPAQPQND